MCVTCSDNPHLIFILALLLTTTLLVLGGFLVLKGSGSLIASPDGRLALVDHGHPAMATGGLGDVLAGVIGALLAQKMAPFDAACLAVWLHALAGEKCGASGRGLAAADLIPVIRQLLEEQQPCLS